jgi:hypothetical protein
MSRTCTICNHQDREAINVALLGTESLRNLAGRWSVSKTALLRHKAEHLPASLVKAVEVEQEMSGGKLLERLTDLNRETAAILREARTTKDNQLALKAIARAEKQLEFEGRLLGELNANTAVNVTLMPEWQDLRVKILRALEPHPAARLAVLGAIREDVGATK